MKRHLVPPSQVIAIPTLSVEEEAILADQQSEAEIAVDNCTDEVERIGDVADIANDTITVVNEVPEVGQVEQELVAAVADMAVAGTDAVGEEVLSVKTGEDGAASTEGIAATLKKIWDAIVTAIKNMWVGIKHWVGTYFSTLEQNKQHAEKIISKLEGMKGYVPNVDNSNISILDILGYSGYKGLKELFGGIEQQESELRKYVVDTVTKQHQLMGAFGEGLESAYKSFGAGDSSELNKVITELINRMSGYLKAIGISKPEKGEVWAAKLKAAVKVEVKNFSDTIGNKENSLETQIAYLSKIRFSAEQSTDLAPDRKIMFKNDTTPDMMVLKAKSCLEFIEQLLKLKAEQFGDLEKQVEKVEKACGDMLNRIKPEDKANEKMAKQLMPLTTAYANWAIQPSAKLLVIASRHNRFWLSLMEMVSNNYVPVK